MEEIRNKCKNFSGETQLLAVPRALPYYELRPEQISNLTGWLLGDTGPQHKEERKEEKWAQKDGPTLIIKGSSGRLGPGAIL
jgi:hypothetical protein